MPSGSQVGKLLIAGFEGTTVTAELRELITEHSIAGVILFQRNIESLPQLIDLVTELRQVRPEPLLISIDHEGGRVMRVEEPFTKLPPFRALGLLDDEAAAENWGHLVAAELLSVGVDLNFAPVLDVDSNPHNPVIGDRALAADPGTVGFLGKAVILGMREKGLLTCCKHFPGHGDTEQDSHTDLPQVGHPAGRLDAVELPPFQAAVEAGTDAVMTAHVVYEALDPGIPATLSPGILNGILRQRWGYDGAIVTDDLEMAAISKNYGPGEAAVLAILAGCDVLLCCRQYDQQCEMIEHLSRSAQNGRILPHRLAESLLRVEMLQIAAALNQPDLGLAQTILGNPEHLAFCERLQKALADGPLT